METETFTIPTWIRLLFMKTEEEKRMESWRVVIDSDRLGLLYPRHFMSLLVSFTLFLNSRFSESRP